MRSKIIVSLLGLFMMLFIMAGTSFAATSVRLQTPPSQTNKDALDLTFVALDTVSSQTVTVDCYKKGPSDGSFSVFQSFSLPNGGNTNNCNAHFNQGNGTYNFYVKATGSDTSTSSTVGVDFNNSSPGIPTGYNKSKPDSCTYKISFRTADDSGKTVKVVLYRSTDTSFSADSGHQVNSLNIGSNTDGSMTDNINPNCNTNYYYVIRAFDAYGNGSGLVGDSNTVTINPTETPAQGAIPVGGSTLGTGTGTEQGGEVLGTESAKPTVTPSQKAEVQQNPVANGISWILTHKKISLLVLVLLVLAFYLYRRFYRRSL